GHCAIRALPAAVGDLPPLRGSDPRPCLDRTESLAARRGRATAQSLLRILSLADRQANPPRLLPRTGGTWVLLSHPSPRTRSRSATFALEKCGLGLCAPLFTSIYQYHRAGCRLEHASLGSAARVGNQSRVPSFAGI